MVLLHSYVLYNNKGGVGKSTLCFHLATEYAHRHANQAVLIIDACPQASVSSTLYNTQEIRGIQRVSQLSRELVTLRGQPREHITKNICGYLSSKTHYDPDFIAQPAEYGNFLVRPGELNPSLPPNISLLAGDGSLELVCRGLDYIRGGARSHGSDPWVRITTLLKEFVQQVTNQPGDNREWVVFIDTNPAFSLYTEMAIVAGTRLVVPSTADDYSLNALVAMFELIYGWANPNPTFAYYRERTFAHYTRTHGIPLPKIHLFIANRTTWYNQRSAAAYSVMQRASAAACFQFYQGQLGPAEHAFPASQAFTAGAGPGAAAAAGNAAGAAAAPAPQVGAVAAAGEAGAVPAGAGDVMMQEAPAAVPAAAADGGGGGAAAPAIPPAATAQEFHARHFRDMMDLHQFAIVCSYTGRPLYAVRGGNVNFYNIQTIKVNKDPHVEAYCNTIQALANDLQ